MTKVSTRPHAGATAPKATKVKPSTPDKAARPIENEANEPILTVMAQALSLAKRAQQDAESTPNQERTSIGGGTLTDLAVAALQKIRPRSRRATTGDVGTRPRCSKAPRPSSSGTARNTPSGSRCWNRLWSHRSWRDVLRLLQRPLRRSGCWHQGGPRHGGRERRRRAIHGHLGHAAAGCWRRKQALGIGMLVGHREPGGRDSQARRRT